MTERGRGAIEGMLILLSYVAVIAVAYLWLTWLFSVAPAPHSYHPASNLPAGQVRNFTPEEENRLLAEFDEYMSCVDRFSSDECFDRVFGPIDAREDFVFGHRLKGDDL